MTTKELLLALLSSSFFGGVVGAFITGRFNLRVKDLEYKNEYYKQVLEKRIDAYESVEKLVTGFKTAVVDDDRQPYHFILSHEDGLLDAHKLLYEISSQALWLSDDLFLETRNLSLLLYGGTSHADGPVAFAKKHHEELAKFREKIERLHIRDMLSLHEVGTFLKTKKIKSGFSNVQLGG